MRTLLKILGALYVIILVLLFWALDRVDYSPYFESDYYHETKTRLDSLGQKLTRVKGKVFIGTGKTSITPGIGSEMDHSESGNFIGVPLAGYGNRKGAFAEGTHDSLFIKTVAIRVEDKMVVMIGSDILIVPPNISEEVSRIVYTKLGLTRDQLYFTATHTHSGVGAWSEGFVGEQFAGPPNTQIVDWLVKQYSHAIEIAVKDIKPGRIGTGSFEAADFISNRLIGERGEKNSEFVFLLAEQDEGKKIIIGSYGAHATTLGGWNRLFSGDYPGYWQHKLEREVADLAVFFAGSVGSHSARSKGEKFERSRYIGEALADSVIKYSQLVELSDSIKLAHMSLNLTLPESHIRISDGTRLNPALAGNLFPEIGDVYIQTARIGDLIWVTTPCDFSGESAIIHKNAMYKEGYKTLITSFNGAYVGYIIPDKYYHLYEYESRLMSWYGPGMAPYVNEMIGRLMIKLVSI
jgi:hypothetical protein